MYNKDDYLMLSGIQHFAFCRRQWALIHIEQQWAENYQTTAGELMHKRAHDESLVEKRGDKITVRGMRIASHKLGVSGQCDVVELKKDKNGITLSDYEGTWSVMPVEYKRGKPKEGKEDELQLCAQAMCLEEMLITEIAQGALYYGETKRRTTVLFTENLRKMVEESFVKMHELFKKGYTPIVKRSKKCNACSLKELCVPKLEKTRDVREYINSEIAGDI